MSVSNICLTPQCITTAATILQNLHPNYATIDPCTDFDQYVCGGFAKRVGGQDTQQVNIHIIQTILENDSPPSLSTIHSSNNSNGIPRQGNEDELAIFQKLRQNYASCMDETTINREGREWIWSLISNVVDRFPLADGYTSSATMNDEDVDAFANATGYLASIGVSLFGDFSTFQDMENPDTIVPWYTPYSVYRVDRTLPVSQKPYSLLSTKAGAEVINATLFGLLPDQGVNSLPANANPRLAGAIPQLTDAIPQLVEGIVAMTEAFAVIEQAASVDAVSLLNETWQMTTVAEAARLAPVLGIDKVINHLAPEGYHPDRMMLSFPSVYGNVSDIVASTPKAVLLAAMVLRIAEFYSSFTEASPMEDRKRLCFDYLDNSTPWIMSKFFLDKTYSEKNQQAYMSVAESVKDAFVERVRNTSWLSKDSRVLATEKARDVQLNVGYPQEDPDARNATSLKEYYAGADITASWFANALSLRKWDVKKSWDALLRPVNRLKWLEYGVRSYTVNARASLENNMIMMPATFGSLPFFDPGLPLYSQYGRIGFIVGHEIVHNFDNVGMRIDQERTTKDWLSTDSAAAFAERAECIREQYSRVPVVLANGRVLTDPQSNKELHVNGNKTLSENIADQGGLSIAYEAWKKAEAASARSAVLQLALPGLEAFSREQLFFITFGQSWCSRHTEEEVLLKVALSDHAPPFARTRITPMNVEGFKKAWQCEDPAPVCKVW